MVRKSGQTDICAFILMAAMIVATGMVSGQDRALPGKEADLKIQKAERHLFRGEFDSAKALFDSLARDKTCDEKTRARAAWGRAQCLVVEKRWAASADSISGLMTSGVRTPGPAVWHAAESYWRAGLVEKAESVFRLLSTREGPLRIRAVVHRALCMAFLGRLDEAETFVVENMGLAATNDEKALLFLARSYLSYRKGRSAESAMLARSALDLAGGDMKTRCAVTVACAELSAGNSMKALNIIENIQAGTSKAVSEKLSLIRRAASAMSGKKEVMPDLEKELRSSAEFAKTDQAVSLLLLLGELYSRNGELESALRCWNEALPKAGGRDKSELLRRIGYAYAGMKRLDLACESFDRAGDTESTEALCNLLLESNAAQPGRFMACFRLALIRAAEGQAAKAAKLLSDGVQGLKDPGLKDAARLAKAYFHEKAGGADEALRIYEELSGSTEARIASAARCRLLVLGVREGLFQEVSEFYGKLPEKTRNSLGEDELYAVAVSHLRLGLTMKGTNRAAMLKGAKGAFKALLVTITGRMTLKTAGKNKPGPLVLPSLTRYTFLAQERGEILFALETLEKLLAADPYRRFSGSDGEKDFLSMAELLVAAEIKRRLGHWPEAAELYASALAKAGDFPRFADLVRLQMGGCIMKAGLHEQASAAFDGIADKELKFSAVLGKACAAALSGDTEKALAILDALSRQTTDSNSRARLEDLRSKIEKRATGQ